MAGAPTGTCHGVSARWPPWLAAEPRPRLEPNADDLWDGRLYQAKAAPYPLLGRFREGAAAEELLMMARAVWCARRTIYAEACTRSLLVGALGAAAQAAAASLAEAVAAYRTARAAVDLVKAQDPIRAVLSWYNHTVRLALRNNEEWPRAELAALARAHTAACDRLGRGAGAASEDEDGDYAGGPSQVLPPQTPCEYVEEPLAWWGFGQYDRAAEWLGHGYFWRGPPNTAVQAGLCEGVQPAPLLENAAGNAVYDFDVLEDGFLRLRRASVLCADYALLQRHFRALRGKSEGEVDEWLLEQAAWLSQGQMRRMQPGGDHHDLLGMGDRLAEVIDEDSARAGLRIRSGGRAATFLATAMPLTRMAPSVLR